MYITVHVQQNLLHFAKNIPKNDRTLKTWTERVELMFKHLEGQKIDNYRCPVVMCPCRNFFENARGQIKSPDMFRKNFTAQFVNLEFI